MYSLTKFVQTFLIVSTRFLVVTPLFNNSDILHVAIVFTPHFQ